MLSAQIFSQSSTLSPLVSLQRVYAAFRISTLRASSDIVASPELDAPSERIERSGATSTPGRLDQHELRRHADPQRDAAGAEARGHDQVPTALHHQAVRPAQRRTAGVGDDAEAGQLDLAAVGVAGQRQIRARAARP